MRRLVRLGMALLTAMALLALGVSAALADSPHFISASASVNGAGSLVATFKESGLGTTVSTEKITLSADASAVYACLNGGGNHPKAANKETVSGPLSNSGNFPVRNGQTTGSISAGPLGPGNFACPSGQKLVLAFVSYTNVTLTGLAGDTANIPGPFSRCLFSVAGIC
jgi:hypothetical protein